MSRARKGLWGEYVAMAVFVCRGYRIIAHRFRCPAGEIDIIARRGKVWVFIEVKVLAAGRTLEQALPSPVQRARIVRAAKVFMAYRGEGDMRFDVVLVRRLLTWKIIENVW
ncbi:MAG: YraN family protein [Pseudomonadota bacterium]